jgi:hypothetical protein
VEIILSNRELVVKQIVNVPLVKLVFLYRTRKILLDFFSIIGIKETETEKYPMKGYLAIREGDILCVPKDSNGTAKHMADLVKHYFKKNSSINFYLFLFRFVNRSVSLVEHSMVRR